MKYDYKKKRKKIYALILLLVITIGYALISTTLKINGVAGIKSNTWNIHWENVQVNTNSTVTADEPVIDTNKTKVTYEVTLELPGDYYEFNVDAKNSGTINGIIDKIRHNVYEEDGTTSATLPEYIKYSIVYAGTKDAPAKGDILAAGEKQTYTIRIEYDSEATTLPATDLTYKIVDEIDYVQTSEEKEKTGFVVHHNLGEPTFGCGSFGDEFCIGDECFNMLSCDDNTAVLLAKYNLLVGNTCTDQNTCTPIPTTTEGYGKQSSTAVGLDNSTYTYPAIGVLPFSDTDYWLGNVGEGKKFPGTVKTTYDWGEEYTSAIMVLSEESYLYTPLMNYLQYLKSLGAHSNSSIRLVNAQNLYNLCYEKDSSETSFLYNTNYWGEDITYGCSDPTYFCQVGAIYNSYYGFGGDVVTEQKRYGVRPVIEVPTSSIAYDWWVLTNSKTPLDSQKWQYWENGKKLIEGWYKLDDFYGNKGWFYFEDGFAKTGWHEENGNKYYLSTFDEDGNGYLNCNRLENTTKEINGVSYTFDNDGICTNCS